MCQSLDHQIAKASIHLRHAKEAGGNIIVDDGDAEEWLLRWKMFNFFHPVDRRSSHCNRRDKNIQHRHHAAQ